MDFRLTEERQMLQDTLRRFLASGAAPWDGLVEMGVIAVLFPEAQGGFGGDGFDIMIVFEELGRAGADTPLLETVLAGTIWAEIDPNAAEKLIGGERASLRGEGGPEDLDTLLDIRDGALALTGGAPIGPLPQGLLAQARARAIAAQCAEALGLMEAIMTLTLDYLRTRSQFGKPIGSFQALQHRMADLAIEVQQVRSAVINLCGNLDDPDRDRFVSACKVTTGQTARRVIEEAIQMHGGIGMTQDYALAPLVRRLNGTNLRFGSADHHLARFAGLVQA